jgi:hypothetical protein
MGNQHDYPIRLKTEDQRIRTGLREELAAASKLADCERFVRRGMFLGVYFIRWFLHTKMIRYSQMENKHA